jgi:hypothetical protein
MRQGSKRGVLFAYWIVVAGCGGPQGVLSGGAVGDEPDAGLESSQDCRGPGRYEAGKEGSYRPCCEGLREVFYMMPAEGDNGAKICVSPPLRIYACVQGKCGDATCEVGESGACGCVADCPSAAWGDQPSGEVGSE